MSAMIPARTPPSDRSRQAFWQPELVAAAAPSLAIVLLLSGGCTGEPPDGRSGKASEAAGSPLAEAATLSEKGLDLSAARLVEKAASELPARARGDAYARAAGYFHAAGSWSRALEASEEARKSGVDSADLLYIRGDSLRELSRLDESRETLEGLLSREPDHAPGKLALARLLFRVDDPKRALPLFEAYLKSSAAEEEPRHEALLEYSRALRAAGRYQDAADQLVLLLERRPTESSYYSELARVFYRMRRKEAASFVEAIYRAMSERSFEKEAEGRLRLSGMTGMALSQEALNLAQEKRYLEALRKHRLALEVGGSDPRVSIYAAELSLRLARRREAREILARAIERDARPASGLFFLRGIAALEKERFEEALGAFEKARRALAEEGDAGGVEKGQAREYSLALATGRARFETGDLEGASALFAKQRRLFPDAWEPVYWEGRVFLEGGDLRDALASFEEATRRGGASFADLRFFTAMTLSRSGNTEQAMQALSSVLAAEPGRIEAYDRLLELASRSATRAPEPARVREQRDKAQAIVQRIEALEARIQETPLEKSGPLYAEMGRLALRLRRPEAQDFLMLALDLEPRADDVARLLVRNIQRNEDVFFRMRYLRRLLEIDPDDPLALQGITTVYTKLQVRLDEAERLAERLHELAPNATSYRLLGEARLAKGKTEAARSVLEEGAARFPKDERLRLALERARNE